MLIINADDWGRSVEETDAALRCYKEGRITSVSAMVFMKDSQRAADLAKENNIDVGLHLNLTEKFMARTCPTLLQRSQERIAPFLRGAKYSQLLYNPFLRKEISYSYEAQAAEFERLYGKPPSHVDGHHHMHLCGNMLWNSAIPSGTRMRRNFSFWPGEKGWLNRTYRALVDYRLARKYRLPDYFFCLSQSIQENKLGRVEALARSSKVELMTHPVVPMESDFLMGHEFRAMLQRLEIGGYALV
jgi:chitin disaccharide deacetylase